MGNESFWTKLKYIFSDDNFDLLKKLKKNYELIELIKNHLNEITSSQNKNVDELKSFRTSLSNLKSDVSEIKNTLDSKAEKVSEMEKRLSTQLENELKRHSSQEHNKKAEADYSGQIAHLSELVAGLEKKNQELERKIDLCTKNFNAGNSQQIAAIQQKNETLNKELNEYKYAIQNLASNLQQAQIINRNLEQKLQGKEQQLNDVIAEAARNQEKLAQLSRNQEVQQNDNLFQLEVSKEYITAENIETFLENICNTEKIDALFTKVEEDNSYKKMFARYKKNIGKCVDRFDEDDEIEDSLGNILNSVQSELLKKIVIAIYLGSRKGNSTFEKELLACINEYLSMNGFYTRNNIVIGDAMKEEDYDDMEFVKGEPVEGKSTGTIVEIQLHPYYLNYIDEDGNKQKIHTQGMMIVSA